MAEHGIVLYSSQQVWLLPVEVISCLCGVIVCVVVCVTVVCIMPPPKYIEVCQNRIIFLLSLAGLMLLELWFSNS